MRKTTRLLVGVLCIALPLTLITLGHAKKRGSGIWGDVTFDDAMPNRIAGDGLGTYVSDKPSTGHSINTSDGHLTFSLARPRDGRSVMVDFSDCASDTCVSPFDPGQTGNLPVTIYVWGGLASMTPGETKAVRPEVHFTYDSGAKREGHWEFDWNWLTLDDPNACTATASDTDDDGVTDTWVVTSPPDTVVSGRMRIPPHGSWESVGSFYLPFQFAFKAR